MMDDNEECDGFIPPEYEVETAAEACTRNSLIYCFSRRSRNYICVTVIKSLLYLTEQPDKKQIIVLTPNPIINEVFQTLRRTLYSVGVMSVFDENSYVKESRDEASSTTILKNKVNVLSESCLTSLIRNGILHLDQVALIVFFNYDLDQKHAEISQIISQIKQIDENTKPQILCLTSKLADDESDVKESLHELENLWHCKLVPADAPGTLARILPGLTKTIFSYEKYGMKGKSCIKALQLINDALEKCLNSEFLVNTKVDKILGSSEKINETRLKIILNQVMGHVAEFGEYGAGKAISVALRHLGRLFTFTDRSSVEGTKHMLNYLVCTLIAFRKVVENDMIDVPNHEQIEKFSSEKVMLILKHLMALETSEQAIILVKDSEYASILAALLTDVANVGNKFSHLKTELIVNGTSIPLSNRWDDILTWERNAEVYTRYVTGATNTLVLSSDPDNLDFPTCDILFVMDELGSFSQYMKIKSSVKNRTGKLVLMIEETKKTQYTEKIAHFQNKEKELQEMLLKRHLTDNKDALPHKKNSEASHTCKMFGEKVSLSNALPLLSRYCTELQSDHFTQLQPIWWIKEVCNAERGYVVYVKMPLVSPLKEIIQGDLKKSLKCAKQSAALRACENLSLYAEPQKSMYHLTVETEKLKLAETSDVDVSLCTEDEVVVDLCYPKAFDGTQPKSGVKSYVHKIKMNPVSEAPSHSDSRKVALYELLLENVSFAIVSSKPLPKICSFPLFVYGHDLLVEVEPDNEGIQLSSEQLCLLRQFHSGLFLSVHPLVQSCMLFDVDNKQNNFFLVPTSAGGDIDWEIVRNHYTIPDCRELTYEEKLEFICTKESHERTMVMPRYRCLQMFQVYLVASVCTDMSAESDFPTYEFETYSQYYLEKYGIKVVRPELPLLEVYLIDTKINGLMPRSRFRKLRREEKMEEFREQLIPEMCLPMNFPAALWLKLAALPSVIHRIARLLIIEDLRELLIKETGVGTFANACETLTVDKHCCEVEPSPPKLPPSTVKRGRTVGNVKLEQRKRLAQLNKPWGLLQEPCDLYRNIESVNLLEVNHFDVFLIESASAQTTKSSEEQPFPAVDEFEDGNVLKGKVIPKMEIKLLRPRGEECGPQQHALLEAFTASSAADVLSMDRVSILGRAFLNFASSVFICCKHPHCEPSKLWQFHESLIGRKNLFKSAVKKQLCGRIQVIDFAPGDWIPPCFTTPHWLKEILIEDNISPSVLQHLNFSKSEQLSGSIDPDSEDYIAEILKIDSKSVAKREEVFIDRQFVSTENGAACVEALVGTYFRACGWEDALKIVGWLDLIPLQDAQGLLDYGNPCAPKSFNGAGAGSLSPLETILGYQFNDQLVLMEALTHISYVNANVHFSMDRFAFLGQSILDFLLTTYIFETCSHLKPSKLLCLREVLIRRTTLACLAVRHGVHKFLLMCSPYLLEAVNKFVKYQEEHNHIISDEVHLLLEEHECDNMHSVEVPNVLCNLVPSLVAAIYFDTGRNLSTVWNIIQPMFLPEISKWREDVPLSVVGLLLDLSPAAHQVIFSTRTDSTSGVIEVSCRIIMDNTRDQVFLGRGSDESLAKTLAAKFALRALLGSQTEPEEEC